MVLAWELQHEYSAPIVAVRVDNRLEDLRYVPDKDCFVEMVDMSSEAGIRVYARSLALVVMRAAHRVFPDRHLEIQHSLNKGFYGELLGNEPLTPEMVGRLRTVMWDIIRAAEPIDRLIVSCDEAIRILRASGQRQQANLLTYRNREPVNLYTCGGLIEVSDEILVPHTGLITTYQLEHYASGFLCRHPDFSNYSRIPVNVEQKKLGAIFRESDKWAKIVKVANVSQLNNYVESGDTGELIRIAEALHEKQIAQIADLITAQREKLRLVLIAGPSSSGKTTFAQRLKIQLRVNGLEPVTLSLDDYFHNRDKTPRDEAGNLDFEALGAIDCDLFNVQLAKLIAGEAVAIPHYDFHTGQRVDGHHVLQIRKDQPLIVEGIHGLNEELTKGIARANKYKIYISALNQLNLDLMNYIKTTDARCIRRIVRDYQFRSSDARKTLNMWPSVRRGEERWIFPFQEEADVLFNSALVYELAVLSRYAKPILGAIKQEDSVFGEAER
ncbi:MAG: nucleoside kinase, partial [Heliobacteriaceae bacterium]|nr:nucleoside kinase [Heliobacteriaceae bacterium]